MSQWTHVAGIIRVDGLGFVLGLTDQMEIDKLDRLIRLSNVPCGSEGPMEYLINHHHQTPHVNRGTITLWGDLRDFDDVDGICEWFKSIVDKFGGRHRNFPFLIRDAILTIDKEYAGNRVICAWDGESLTQTEIENKD